MSDGHRILVMAHGHPEIIRGGGEISAYNLFSGYKASDDVDQAWFLACTDNGRGALGRIQTHRPGEYLWEQSLSSFFLMKAANRTEVTGFFAELIRNLRPTVVHSHHYFMLGLEYLKVLKTIDPAIRTVLTLHDYMAICPNRGMMLRQDDHTLCASGHYADHVGCVPDKTAEDLWLRKHRFDRYFDHVDHFVSPSAFLRDRYIEWGIAPDRISVVENGQPQVATPAPRPVTDGQGRNRFGFFGQINAPKGLDVLLSGLAMMSPEARRRIVLEVHGANLERQPLAFRERISELAHPLIAEGTVHWVGPYDPQELGARMAGVDWVVVPSVWYENSPMVIQEAYAHGRPVIVSGIGGMAEKVQDGVTGITLPRGNGRLWAETMLRLADEPETWDRLAGALSPPISIAECTQAHLGLIDGLKGRAA